MKKILLIAALLFLPFATMEAAKVRFGFGSGGFHIGVGKGRGFHGHWGPGYGYYGRPWGGYGYYRYGNPYWRNRYYNRWDDPYYYGRYGCYGGYCGYRDYYNGPSWYWRF